MMQALSLKVISVSIIVLVLLLSGCAANVPHKLGISSDEWSKYTSEDKNRLIYNYKSISSTHQDFNYKKSNKNNDPALTDKTFLKIAIYGGKVMMPPYIEWQCYQPIFFTIPKEQCRNVVLYSQINSKIRTSLALCFCNNILYIDPSRYDLSKKNGSISINYSPLWLSGFSYKNINSSGYARLKDVTIEVMQIEK